MRAHLHAFLSALSRPSVRPFLLAAAAAVPAAAWAHVKWFSEFSFADRPLTLGEALGPTALALAALSVVTVGALVLVDLRLTDSAWYRRIDERLAALRDRSPLVLRIGAGASLLLAFQGDAVFVPELEVAGAWVGWVQFGLALLLLFRRTVPLAGIGMLALYGYGFAEFTALHMLDYLFFAGVGYYFVVSGSERPAVRDSGLPALYLTVGFSLCWVALEKLVYPQWGLYVLSQNPQLALGFELDFFLTAAAFVEFSLGYLLIICLMQRPLALVITLVFFSTTLVFGKLEVVGHTLIHAALIVFILEGPGTGYRAPYAFHRRPALRVAFTSVNFALLFAVLVVPYVALAQGAYERHVREAQNTLLEAGPNAPAVALAVEPDPTGGYTVRVDTERFRFAPDGSGQAHAPGEGHAHLYLDGRKVARLYGPWHHLDDPGPGAHTLAVVLSSNDHRLYAVGGEPVAAEYHLGPAQPPSER